MATGDGTSTFAVVPAPPAEPPVAGLIASLGQPGGIYLDPPDTFDPVLLPPFDAPRPNPWEVSLKELELMVRGPGTPPQRWEGGFQYLPEQVCSSASITDPCAPTFAALPAQPQNVQAMPGLVVAGDSCSAFGWQEHDFVGRAVRATLAVESKQIAAELWKGTQAQTSAWPNRYLASTHADVLSSGASMSPAQALDVLEQGLAQCGNGQRGAIHCTPQLGSFWSGLGNTVRNLNGQIMTYRGTLIIADAGYDGSSPHGAPATSGQQWAYATLIPQVRRGAIDLDPGTYEEALDKRLNTITWYATRAAAATFPYCCHLAVAVDLPLALVGGAS